MWEGQQQIRNRGDPGAGGPHVTRRAVGGGATDFDQSEDHTSAADVCVSEPKAAFNGTKA